MKEAEFNLRSWSSNVAADATDVNVLGMKWNSITDTLPKESLYPITAT